MTQFTYDSCLLYIIVISRTDMRIVNMQTDDTLILTDQSFVVVEKEAIHSIKIMTKTREQLTFENALKFNDTRIERRSNDTIYYRQEKHIQKIQLIKIGFTFATSVRDKIRAMLISKKQYTAQRAREAYLISICQSKASFDLFYAAQIIEMSSDDIKILNRRLQ
jgi:hypothetical protein